MVCLTSGAVPDCGLLNALLVTVGFEDLQPTPQHSKLNKYYG